MPLRERIARFMEGRNGPDTIYHVCFYLYLAIFVVNIFVRSPWINLFAFALLGYIFFRLLSRNLYARQRENARFVAFFKRIGSPFSLWKVRFRDRKTHVFKKCPHCKSVLRLPKKRGTHTVCCPRCHDRFDLKI